MPVTRIKAIFDQKGRIKGYLDIYTGKEYNFPVLVGKKESPYEYGFYMGNQILAREVIAKDKDIKGETHRVLWLLISILDFENWIQISVTDLAKEIDMLQPNVSKAIKVLEKKEIILRGPKIGRSSSFRFNPEILWKGKVKNLNKYRKEKEDERIKDLKNKTNKRKQKKLEDLSKKYNISIEELVNLKDELNLT